jgi:hypothetical protein
LLHNNGELDEVTLLGFANERKYEEVVVALAVLSETSIDIIKPLMKSPRVEGLLVSCRAARLRWPVVRVVLECRLMPALTREALAQTEIEFGKLTEQSAQRLLRFWKVREASARSAAG